MWPPGGKLELKEVETIDTAQLNTVKVQKGPLHVVVCLVDDKGGVVEDIERQPWALPFLVWIFLEANDNSVPHFKSILG